MKLTPLGKVLLVGVGLAIIAAAAWRFLPKETWSFLRSGSSPGSPSGPSASPSGSAAPRRARSPAREAAEARPVPSPSADAGWISIPAGPSPAGDSGVAVTTGAFAIRRHEVTNREYAAFVAACAVGSDCGPRELPSYWDDVGYLDTHQDHPVVFVSWGDAEAYARWAGGRLPSIEEWEKAARGPDGARHPWGEEPDPSRVNILGANHDEKTKAAKQIPTWPVGDPRYGRDATPLGVLAMAGNVSEWTASPSPAAPTLMLVAGGSWDSWDLSDAQAWHRVPKRPTDRSSSVGFRVVKDLP